MANRIDGDLQIGGTFRAKSIVVPDDFYLSVDNSQHRNVRTFQQSPGTDVVAATQYLYIAANNGKLSSVVAFVETPPSGAGVDKTVTIDVKRSTGGGAFVTVLSSVLTIDHTASARSVIAASINPSLANYDGDDAFEVVVAVAGSAGSQAQGIIASLTFDEEAG